jgi:hypothetical protein
VRTSRAALAAPHQYLDVVYKVRGHCLSYFQNAKIRKLSDMAKYFFDISVAFPYYAVL